MIIQDETNSKTSSGFKAWCAHLISKKGFDYFIFSCVILNSIILGVVWFGEPPAIGQMRTILNYALTSIFLVEAILKIVGLTPKAYFDDNWNRFDFVILVLTVGAEVAS